ncbi:MAG TPA: SDR family oxidoreductase [Anaeromyxobacteraceae bacterium]|nr:SDR family oxidoreductase [Anaeromyxobacteraceae bacterium]
MSRILVIGASGQVGRACAEAFVRAGHEVAGTCASRPVAGLLRLDLLDAAAVRATLDAVRPDAVVLSAALTNVDRCEDEPRLAEALNAETPAVVAEVARARGARVVQLSTEYVFDGEAGPYSEGDAPRPLQVYGATKLAGERVVLAASPDNLAVRTTVVFGHDPGGKNFVMQLRDRLGRGERMRVPADQVSSPTYAPDLADAIVRLLERGAAGVVNVVGPEVMDRHAFAVLAARALGLDPSLLDPVPTSALGQRARRPLRVGLTIGLLRSLCGEVMRPTQEALLDVAARGRSAGDRA